MEVSPKSGAASPIALKCATACMNTAYQYLFEHCHELHAAQFPKQVETSNSGSKSLNSVQFWHKMIDLIVSAVEEDTPSHVPQQAYVSHLTVQIMWECYNDHLRIAMLEHAEHKRCKSADYMNLYFKVKSAYNSYVADLPHYKDATPLFPAYFVPFVLQWLNENDTISMDCLRGAYNRDKSDNFPSCSDRTKFSNSVVDVFAQLNQTLDVLMKVDLSDAEIKAHMMDLFVKTVEQVLLSYAEMIQRDFPDFVTDDKLAFIMMNNVQQLRINLEKMYKVMGAEKLHPGARATMNNLQTKLNSILEKIAPVFVQRVEPSVVKAISSMAERLCAKECPTSSNAQPAKEADSVVDPLMLFLDGELSKYRNQCEKTVLKYLLKVPGKAPERTLSPRQCRVLKTALDILKEYFHAGGNGLKQAYLGKSSELNSLKRALSFCALTTDELITAFIGGQRELDAPSRDQSTGDVSLHLDLLTNDHSGARKLCVKVLAANSVHNQSTIFKPFIEVNLYGSGLADGRRKFSTRSKSTACVLKYNGTFQFVLGPESECMLVLHLRDYTMFSDNKLVSVAALPLAEFLKKGGSHSVSCQLGQSLTVDHTGEILLRILGQRKNDDVAKEFVKFNTATRSV